MPNVGRHAATMIEASWMMVYLAELIKDTFKQKLSGPKSTHLDLKGSYRRNY